MGTIKDIVKISISGANFKQPAMLPIFKKSESVSPKRVSLIYGENGSGKSTIGRGIYYQANQPNVTNMVSAEFFDDKNQLVDIQNASEHIFIFNEDYVQRQVGIANPDPEALQSIVILGTAKNLDEKIQALKAEKIKIIEQYKKQLDIVEDLKNPNNTSSPFYYLTKAKEILKADDGWADRKGQIKGYKTKAGVGENQLSNIFYRFQGTSGHFKGEADPEVLLNLEGRKRHLDQQFVPRLQSFLAAKGKNIPITEIKIPFSTFRFEEDLFIKILNETIEKAQLNNRDKFILDIEMTMEEKGIKFIEMAKNDFLQNNVEQCPYCHQPINKITKENLVRAIEIVLGKRVDDFIDQVSHFYLEKNIFHLSIPWDRLADLKREDLISKFKDAVELFKGKIQFIDSLVDKKKENPYVKVSVNRNEIAFNDALKKVNEAVEKLNSAIKEYNAVISKQSEKEAELENLNDEIGFCEIYGPFKSYLNAEGEFGKQKNIAQVLERKSQGIEKEITRLESEKRQVKLAMKEINDSLAYIFFSKDRLQIEYDEEYDVYFIKVRGEDVRPIDISVGERNAIALAYFFTALKNGKEESTFYKNDYFLVIDDPVSSFDRENRIGVISYLRKELIKFLEGNLDTKILILTHDMQVLFDLQKVFDSLKNNLKRDTDFPPGQVIPLTFILHNQKLEYFESREWQTYTSLLQKTYDFACGNFEHEAEIGNIMRRILEAYGTFIYKEGGANLFNSDKALADIENLKYRKFFKNLMMRIGLNSESHLEETTKTLNDMNFFAVAPDRKQRYAQYMLSFLYCLNPSHVLTHLKTAHDNEETIKHQFQSWLHEIDEIQME